MEEIVAKLSSWMEKSGASVNLDVMTNKEEQQQALLKAAALLLQSLSSQVPINLSHEGHPELSEQGNADTNESLQGPLDQRIHIDEDNLHNFSIVNITSSKANNRRESDVQHKVALEVFGKELDDDLARSVVELRVCQIIEAEDKIISLDVEKTSVASLQQFLGNLFQSSPLAVEPSYLHKESFESHRVQKELKALRLAFVRDNIRALNLRESHIISLEHSALNAFKHLTALHLTNNRIKVIDGALDLPHLRLLDLSGNQLKSLDNLQLLTSLTTLLAANNRLDSLDHALTVLLPLADTLSTLDLCNNPVCDDHNYADEALQAFPFLRHLDGLDLDHVTPSYSRSSSRSLPAFPCTQDRYGARVDDSQRDHSSHRADFEKRVRRAVEFRRQQQRKSRSREEYFSKREERKSQTDAPRGSPEQPHSVPRWSDDFSQAADPRESLQSIPQAPSRTPTPSLRAAATPTHDFRASYSRGASQSSGTPSSTRHARPVSASTPPIQSSTSPPRFAVQTSSSKQRRKSQAASLVGHWSGHESSSPSSPTRRRSVLDVTDSFKLRVQAFGIGGATQGLGYHSDTDTHRSCRGLVERKLRREHFEEMQETERYSIWHPRCACFSPQTILRHR